MCDYIPKLVCFSCRFGWGYLNANQAPAGIPNLVPVVCCGKIDTLDIIEAFRHGADGVLLLGCPEGECHFLNGNTQTHTRVLLLKRLLQEFGIEPQRLKVSFSRDPEGHQIRGAIEEMLREIKPLGPLSPTV